jgi:hypothetical protein
MGDSDEERVALLKSVKDFYDARSKLVHGAKLRQKHREVIANVDDVRSLLRRLLAGLVLLASNPSHDFDHSFFQNDLDATLLDRGRQQRLRRTLGIS